MKKFFSVGVSATGMLAALPVLGTAAAVSVSPSYTGVEKSVFEESLREAGRMKEIHSLAGLRTTGTRCRCGTGSGGNGQGSSGSGSNAKTPA